LLKSITPPLYHIFCKRFKIIKKSQNTCSIISRGYSFEKIGMDLDVPPRSASGESQLKNLKWYSLYCGISFEKAHKKRKILAKLLEVDTLTRSRVI